MKKRALGWRLLELAGWTAVAVATAVIMVNLAERLLPANF